MTLDMTLKLCTDNAAVDAYFIGKDDGALAYANVLGLGIEEVAVIADGVKDIPLLIKHPVGLAVAPANAQRQVQDAIRALGPRGHVSKYRVFEAFSELVLIESQRLGIKAILSDRDGVLRDGNDSYGLQFRELMASRPDLAVSVLTGSSWQQNVKFAQEYGFADLDGVAIAAENGAVLYYPKGQRVVPVYQRLEGDAPELFARLTGPFRQEAVAMLPGLLDKFGLRLSRSYGDQHGAVFVPNDEERKLAMFSANIPRTDARCEGKYRKTTAAAYVGTSLEGKTADALRTAMLEEMLIPLAEKHFPGNYKVLDKGYQ